MSNLNLGRGLTRCYLILWALWIGYLLLRSVGGPVLVEWPIRVGVFAILGLVIPGLLLLALRWAMRGFHLENGSR